MTLTSVPLLLNSWNLFKSPLIDLHHIFLLFFFSFFPQWFRISGMPTHAHLMTCSFSFQNCNFNKAFHQDTVALIYAMWNSSTENLSSTATNFWISDRLVYCRFFHCHLISPAEKRPSTFFLTEKSKVSY